ncbi:2-amino-4-hydroxy-6-hydroxymethyldihydropteridine diphosphokinase, partial [Xanthovirga aplysinae]|uniref:2-amino-4-hydroxy-6- hydroxymethyldihydropteridine diphosphokinase n=1 Tax=Xanthovirga aplysinae TaxID=2529853 RepID=UPI0012BB9195
MSGVFLLLGTNLGDRAINLKKARTFLEDEVGLLVKVSSIYETAAWGEEKQPAFYNQVLEVSTDLNPEDLLDKVLEIEKKMGRVRLKKWGQRLIDIDILYYQSQLIDSPKLTVPHPYLHLRRFTLMPLTEIAPNFVHPLIKKDSATLL